MKVKCPMYGKTDDCAGKCPDNADAYCDIESRDTPPVPRFVYDEMKAQHAALLKALTGLVAYESGTGNLQPMETLLKQARAAIKIAKGVK